MLHNTYYCMVGINGQKYCFRRDAKTHHAIHISMADYLAHTQHHLLHKVHHHLVTTGSSGNRAHSLGWTVPAAATKTTNPSGGPKYWAVGTKDAEGQIKYIFMKRDADGKKYVVDDTNFLNSTGEDARTLHRLGMVVNANHGRVGSQLTPGARIDLDKLALVSSVGGSMDSTTHVITASPSGGATMYGQQLYSSPSYIYAHPTTNMLMIRTLSAKKNECQKITKAERTKGKLAFGTRQDNGEATYRTCEGGDDSDCNYLLTVDAYNQTEYERMVAAIEADGKIYSAILPRLKKSWTCSKGDGSGNYFLWFSKGLTLLEKKIVTEENKPGLIKAFSEFTNAFSKGGHVITSSALQKGDIVNTMLNAIYFTKKKKGGYRVCLANPALLDMSSPKTKKKSGNNKLRLAKEDEPLQHSTQMVETIKILEAIAIELTLVEE